jgi:diguanylate cyclase (GGDEF)-like protein/PAS domain S-box-containing protein
MAEERDFYKEIIDNLYDGVYFVDRDRVITYWNKGAERITGYDGNRVIGRSCRDNLLNHVTADGTQLCRDHCPLQACMQDGKVREADVFLHHADGHRLPVIVRASPLRDTEGNIIGAVETFSSDLGNSTVRAQLRELRHSARTDELTGVGNRQYLEARLRGLVAEYEKLQGGGSVLFIDIDHFKQVNDTFGHDVGDRVLRMVAATLKNNLRQTDALGRWGGEEFLAIINDMAPSETLTAVCEKLRSLTESSRLDWDDGSVSVTISIGATGLLPNDTLESVVRRADELMYQSKNAGRNRVTVG